ncbi:LysE family translocator [Salibacteraceae bacterium]|nr:LysE family translocator [Salibacteraceae bacterium]
MDLQLLLGFILATLTLAFMPGPDNIYVLTESISKGWRQGIGITTGLISGVLVHTTVVATGFSLIVFEYDWAFDILKYAGSAYLIYMAYGAFKEKAINVTIGDKAKLEPFSRLFKRGFIMNVLNPKVTLFFMVLLPQFVSTDSNGLNSMWQMVILGLVFMAVSFPVFSSIAIVSGSLASLVQNDRFWVITKWIKITVLFALAILLFLSQKP